VLISSNDCRKIAADLKKYADWSKVFSTAHLEQSQLPDKIPYGIAEAGVLDITGK